MTDEPVPALVMEDGGGEDEYAVVQSLKITIKMNPGKMDADGKQIPPKFEFLPEGEHITPVDCILLATEAIRWCTGALAMREVDRAKEAMKKRIDVPVGGGRGKVIRLDRGN